MVNFLRQFCDHDWYSLPTGNDNAAITFPVDLKTGKMFFDLPNTAHHTLDGQHPPCMVKTLQFQCQIYDDYRISTCIYQEHTKKTTSFFPEFLQQLQASLNHMHNFPMKSLNLPKERAQQHGFTTCQ